MDLQKLLAPLLNVVDQLDTPTVMAITGIMFLLTMWLGGIADIIVLIVGIGLGISISKKLLS